MKNLLIKFFKNQQGAMFGMDARVALLIASVLAATGGITIMSKMERAKVENAERAVTLIADAIESEYKDGGVNGVATIVANLNDLFTNGYIEESTLLNDSWGNAWNYNLITRDIQIEDIPVTVSLAVIHSNGKDEVNDSVAIATPAEWDAWVSANDDIGIKYSTFEVEKSRVDEYRRRGQLIIDKLTSKEAGWYLDADTACPAAAWCTSGGKQHTNFNYYPISSLDANGAVVYFDDVCAAIAGACTATTYTSGNTASMQALMTLLGLSTSLATDPWGRILRYNSNVTNREDPPFTATVWYQ